MKLSKAIDILVKDRETGEALTRVALEFISAIRKNTNLDSEDLVNEIVIEIENEIGCKLGILAESLDDSVAKKMTASEMGQIGGKKSKGGGRPPKADADPKRRERYLKSKEKNDSTE